MPATSAEAAQSFLGKHGLGREKNIPGREEIGSTWHCPSPGDSLRAGLGHPFMEITGWVTSQPVISMKAGAVSFPSEWI